MKAVLDYYKVHLQDDMMSVPLNVFKAVRLFFPSKLQEMNPDIETVEQSLSSIPFITASDILALKIEYPQYVAASKDVSIHHDPLQFWKNHFSTLPSWANAAQKDLLLLPSSASAERVFSLLKNTFEDRQLSSLEDYIEVGLEWIVAYLVN